MIKKTFCIVALLACCAIGEAQSLSLDSCQAMARRNHPLLLQAGVIEQLFELHNKSINAGNLPQIDLTGRASYQSAVTQMNIPIPNVKTTELSKDQYKVYVDIKQKLYDFGASAQRKTLESYDKQVSLQQMEVDLYKIRETVNGLYFSVLAYNENIKIAQLKQQSIEERIKLLSSAVRNGTGLASDLDNLAAERLLCIEQITELLANCKTNKDLLAILIGRERIETEELVHPQVEIATNDSTVKRPELQLYVLQRNKLEQSERVQKHSRLPYLYAFGQVGYGRPGLNMLNNDFDHWYIAGLGFAWNLWDGNKSKHDRAALMVQRSLVDIAKANFARGISSLMSQEQNNIVKYEQLIALDKEVLELKERIAKRSASLLDNGMGTSADYIRDLNASLQSKISLAIHELQLQQSKIAYITIKGE